MRRQHREHDERGSALLVAMLMLALMGLIGIASLETVTRDRQVAGYGNLAQSALYAADAGIAASLDLLRQEVVGAALTQGDCLNATIADSVLADRTLPNGAYFEPDPTAPGAAQICMLAASSPCAEIDASIEQGQPAYLYTVWNVRAQGIAPGGATARIHATAERCHAFNN